MNINELMNKPLWQMTGEEFLAIINEKKPAESAPAPTYREIVLLLGAQEYLRK